MASGVLMITYDDNVYFKSTQGNDLTQWVYMWPNLGSFHVSFFLGFTPFQ